MKFSYLYTLIYFGLIHLIMPFYYMNQDIWRIINFTDDKSHDPKSVQQPHFIVRFSIYFMKFTQSFIFCII